MNNETYGDIDCLKTTNNETFCQFKPLNLMDYSDTKIEEIKKSYSTDIELLNCDQNQNKLIKKDQLEELRNGDLETKILNGLDTNLKTNLLLCNSSNIFNEISEDLIESELNDSENKLNDKLKNELDQNDQLSINGQTKTISSQLANKDLIDKNLISLATEKLLKNSQLEQLIKDKPLMQIEDLECILKNRTIINNLHESSP